jgi:hypothetical protein
VLNRVDIAFLLSSLPATHASVMDSAPVENAMAMGRGIIMVFAHAPATTIVPIPQKEASVRHYMGGRVMEDALELSSLSAPSATAMDSAPVGNVMASAMIVRVYAIAPATTIVPIPQEEASVSQNIMSGRVMDYALKLSSLSAPSATAMDSAPVGNAMALVAHIGVYAHAPATTIVPIPQEEASVRMNMGGRVMEDALELSSLSAPTATAMDSAPISIVMATVLTM